MWVLTGDKQETAIEIGKSCKLIQEDMTLINLSSESEEKFGETLIEVLKTYDINVEATAAQKEARKKQQEEASFKKRICIVIDGSTLVYVMKHDYTMKAFFELGMIASSVICCRVSPKQKADVVGMCKSNGSWITLSIGDGANDVPMIMEAHIGVGVRGKEGTQAVRSADYAVSQFFFLHRLLLVHGRFGYRRVSWLICYYFYKNIVLVFTELSFAAANGYSG